MAQLIVGFSKPKAFFEPFSWLIRLAYWSPVSHAYVKLNLNELNKQIIFQASGLSINLIGQDEFAYKENVYKEFTFPITDQNRIALIGFAIDQLGKSYSVLGVCGIALVRVCKLLGININNPVSYSQSSAFCSELTAYILENYEGLQLGDVANLSPSQLLTLIQNLPILSSEQ